MKDFQQLINDIFPLSEAGLEKLVNSGKEVKIPKKTIIIREGEITSSMYFIKSGVMRGYSSDESREFTFWFAVPGEIAFSSWGYMENKPSPITVTASSDTVAQYYTKKEFEDLFNSSEELGIWGRKLFEKLLFSNDQWLVFFSQRLASQRYMALVEKMPDFLQEVPLKEIASYLGVTPQSLSRIRAEWIKNRREETGE